ncbi:MAG: hypothetical protein AB7O49_10125 [Sphingomonadales bacterium]
MNAVFDPWATLENLKSQSPPANPAKTAKTAKITPPTPSRPIPPEWRDGLVILKAMPCPTGINADRWRRAVQDVADFMAMWGEAARQLGWSDILLFGVDPHAPEQRFDNAGACWLLDGRGVVAVTESRIAVRSRRSRLSYVYRHSAPSGVLLWQLGRV